MNSTVISEEDNAQEAMKSLETLETRVKAKREKARMHSMRISQKASTV